jgi:hypothetical protein
MKLVRSHVGGMEMWTLAQGSRRCVNIAIQGDLLAYQNIYFGTAESLAHHAGRRRRTWYGRITKLSQTEIEFDPIKKDHAGR